MWNNFNNNANRGGNRSRRSNGGFRFRGNRGRGGSPHWDNHYHNTYPQHQFTQPHYGNGNSSQFTPFINDSFQQSHFFRGGMGFERPPPSNFRNNTGRGRGPDLHMPIHHPNQPKRFLSPPHSSISMQRPPSPLPGSEEYLQRNIQHTSDLIKRQLLGGDDSLVESVLNVNTDFGIVDGGVPSVFQRDSISMAQQQYPQQILHRCHVNEDNKKDRQKIRACRNNDSDLSSNPPIDVHEIHRQIVRHISNLSHNKKVNIVNQLGNTAGYDVAILQIQKQKRLELSRALRDLCSSKIAIDPDSDVLHDIIPDIGIKLEDLPREVIEELSSLNAEHQWGYNDAEELEFKHDTSDKSQHQFLSDLPTISPPLHLTRPTSSYIDSTIVDPELCFKQAEQLISGFDEDTSEFIDTTHLYNNDITKLTDELPSTSFTEEFSEQVPDNFGDMKHDLSCSKVICDCAQPTEQFLCSVGEDIVKNSVVEKSVVDSSGLKLNTPEQTSSNLLVSNNKTAISAKNKISIVVEKIPKLLPSVFNEGSTGRSLTKNSVWNSDTIFKKNCKDISKNQQLYCDLPPNEVPLRINKLKHYTNEKTTDVNMSSILHSEKNINASHLSDFKTVNVSTNSKSENQPIDCSNGTEKWCEVLESDGKQRLVKKSVSKQADIQSESVKKVDVPKLCKSGVQTDVKLIRDRNIEKALNVFDISAFRKSLITADKLDISLKTNPPIKSTQKIDELLIPHKSNSINIDTKIKNDNISESTVRCQINKSISFTDIKSKKKDKRFVDVFDLPEPRISMKLRKLKKIDRVKSTPPTKQLPTSFYKPVGYERRKLLDTQISKTKFLEGINTTNRSISPEFRNRNPENPNNFKQLSNNKVLVHVEPLEDGELSDSPIQNALEPFSTQPDGDIIFGTFTTDLDITDFGTNSNEARLSPMSRRMDSAPMNPIADMHNLYETNSPTENHYNAVVKFSDLKTLKNIQPHSKSHDGEINNAAVETDFELNPNRSYLPSADHHSSFNSLDEHIDRSNVDGNSCANCIHCREKKMKEDKRKAKKKEQGVQKIKLRRKKLCDNPISAAVEVEVASCETSPKKAWRSPAERKIMPDLEPKVKLEKKSVYDMEEELLDYDERIETEEDKDDTTDSDLKVVPLVEIKEEIEPDDQQDDSNNILPEIESIDNILQQNTTSVINLESKDLQTCNEDEILIQHKSISRKNDNIPSANTSKNLLETAKNTSVENNFANTPNKKDCLNEAILNHPTISSASNINEQEISVGEKTSQQTNKVMILENIFLSDLTLNPTKVANNVNTELIEKNTERLSTRNERKCGDKQMESEEETEIILRDIKINNDENGVFVTNKNIVHNDNTNEHHQYVAKSGSKSKVEDSCKHDNRTSKSSSGNHRHPSGNTSKKSSSSTTSKSSNNSTSTSKQFNSNSQDGKHDKSTRSSDTDKKHVSRSRSCSSDPSKSSREHSASLEPDKKKINSHATKSSSHKSTKNTKDNLKTKLDTESKQKSSFIKTSSHVSSARSVVNKTSQTDEVKRANIHTQIDLRKRDSLSKYVQVGGVKMHNNSVETDRMPAMVSIRVQTDDQESASFFSSPHKSKSKKNVLAQMRDIDKEIERLLKLKSELYRRANIYSDESEEDTKADVKQTKCEIVDDANISAKKRKRGPKRKGAVIKEDLGNKIRKLRSQDHDELDNNSLENKLRSIVEPVHEDCLKHNMQTRGHKYKTQTDINKELEDNNSIKYILEGSEPEDIYPIKTQKEDEHSSKDNLSTNTMAKEKFEVFTRTRKIKTPNQEDFFDNSTKDTLTTTNAMDITASIEEVVKSCKSNTPTHEAVDNLNTIHNEITTSTIKRLEEEIVRPRKLITPNQIDCTKDSLNVFDAEVTMSVVKRKDELPTRTRKLRTPIQKVSDNSLKDSNAEGKTAKDKRKDDLLITRRRKLKTAILKDPNVEAVLPMDKTKDELISRARTEEVAEDSMKDCLNTIDVVVVTPREKRKSKLRTKIKEIDDGKGKGLLEKKARTKEIDDTAIVDAKAKTRKKGPKHIKVDNCGVTCELVKSDGNKIGDDESIGADLKAKTCSANSILMDNQQISVDQQSHNNLKPQIYSQENTTNKSTIYTRLNNNVTEMQKNITTNDSLNNQSTGIEMEQYSNELVDLATIILTNKECVAAIIAKETSDALNKTHTPKTTDDKDFDGSLPSTSNSMKNIDDDGNLIDPTCKKVSADNAAKETDIVLSNVPRSKLTRNKRLVTRRGNRSDHDDVITQTRMARRIAHKNAEAVKIVEQTRKLRAQRKPAAKSEDIFEGLLRTNLELPENIRVIENTNDEETMEKVLYDEQFEQFARNISIEEDIENVAICDIIECQQELALMQKTMTSVETATVKKKLRKRRILEPVRKRQKTPTIENRSNKNTATKAPAEISTPELNIITTPPVNNADETSQEIQTINANYANLTGYSMKEAEQRSASITSMCASDGFDNLMEVAYEEPIIHCEQSIGDHKGPKRKRRRKTQKYISDDMARRASISMTEAIDCVARNVCSNAELTPMNKETQLTPPPNKTIQLQSSYVNIVRYTLDELLVMKAKLFKSRDIDHGRTDITETTETEIDTESLTSHLDIKCEPRSVDSRRSEHEADYETPPSIEDSRLTAQYSQSDCENTHTTMEMPVLEDSTDADFKSKERKTQLADIDVDLLADLTTEIINDLESQMRVYDAETSQITVDLPRDGPDDEPSTIIDRETFGGCTGPIIAVRAIESYVLGGSDRGCLYIYDLATSTLLHTLDIATKALTALCVVRMSAPSDQSDTLLYAGALDRTVAVVDYQSGAIIQMILCSEPVQCMEYRWGYIFIGTYNGSLCRLSTKTNEIEDTVQIGNTTTVLQLKAAQEGARRVILVATRNQAVSVRDAMTGLLLRTMDTTLNPTVYTLLCDRSFVYCGTSKHDVLIYSFQDGQLIHKLEESNGSGVVCLTSYKKLLFTGCYNGNIYAYKLPSNEYVGVIPGPGGLLLSMDILDNKIAVSTRLNFKSIDIPDTILTHGS